MESLMSIARKKFHNELRDQRVLSIDANGVASNADKSQKASRAVAASIVEQLGNVGTTQKLKGQSAGALFEKAVENFLGETLPAFQGLRPGRFEILNMGSSRIAKTSHLSSFVPYQHLQSLNLAVKNDPELAASLGNSYDISPDVVIVRHPFTDDEVNTGGNLISANDHVAMYTPTRAHNQQERIVHAVVSCKWTLRSDRAQNARSEALNIIRNRKGRTPHIVVVTGEPIPSRLASLALGTGDIDTMYHFALPELVAAVEEQNNSEMTNLLHTLIDGERLRDISDLPFDLMF